MDEHYIPSGGLTLEEYIARGDIAGAHHLARYHWALACVADLAGVRSLVDLGCGAGYGSFLLASRFPHIQVLGVDYDPDAVREAASSYSLPNLTFRLGDGTRWRRTIGGSSFDCVVCFDVIEHVEHREVFLESLVDHLRDDGTLLLSTPVTASTNNLKPGWEFHKIEYMARSLYDLLHRYFDVVRRPDDGSLPHWEAFKPLEGTKLAYLPRLNPVLCQRPRRIDNPYELDVPAEALSELARMRPVAGDWTGHGIDTPGLVCPTTGRVVLFETGGGFRTLVVDPAVGSGLPVSGDWDGSRVDRLGFFDPETATFSLLDGEGRVATTLGLSVDVAARGCLPVAGDWSRTGRDTIGLFDPRTSLFHLRFSNTSGPAEHRFQFGPPGLGWIPVVGNWDGTHDGIGVYDPECGRFYMKTELTDGEHDISFEFGPAHAIPLAGDWDGDRVTTAAIFNVESGSFFLRNIHAGGDGDAEIAVPEAACRLLLDR